jgi:armadillo repeat-containing protein 8
MYLLAHLANGLPGHQEQILAHACLLDRLRHCLVNCKVGVRRPAITCLLQLAKSRSVEQTRRALRNAGVDVVLRQLCELPPHSAAASISPGGRPSMGIPYATGSEADREVRDKARQTLYWLDRPEDDDELMI